MVSAKRQQTVVDTNRFLFNTGQLFAGQYYHIYNARLKEVREVLIQNCRRNFGDDAKNVPLEQLNSALGKQEVFVIGTLFKLMPKQPSILRELENDSDQTDNDNFTSDEDSLILHETDENVKLIGEIKVHEYVTGIPIALLGTQENGGAFFEVKHICYAGPDLSVYVPPPANSYKNDSARGLALLIVSGLEFGFDNTVGKEKTDQIIEALKKLRERVLGEDMPEYEVAKVIIAGNCIAPGFTKAQIEMNASSQTKDDRSLKEVFQMFDKYVHSIAQGGSNIHIMPGKNDPTSFLLPQQPFHPKILPLSGSLANVHPETNPCILNYKDYTILGTSGENVEAILKHSRIERGITALKNTLEWGHIAPSAPDNLSCVPFIDKDPFILDFVPDIYFAGNQPEFAVTTFKTVDKPKIQLITVPSFVKTLSGVLVMLDTLEVELIEFGNK